MESQALKTNHLEIDIDEESNEIPAEHSPKSKRCKLCVLLFIAINIIIILVAILPTTPQTDTPSTDKNSSTSQKMTSSSQKIGCTCSCSTIPNAIQLNSNSCVIPLSDGYGTSNRAGRLFPSWNISEYKDITDIHNETWIVYNNDTNQYEWRHQNEYFSFLILTPNDTTGSQLKILIDASVGQVRPSASLVSSPMVYQTLVDYNCQDIDIVVSTHFHGDHTGWFVKWENDTETPQILPTFPNAKYYSSRIEFDYWNQYGSHRNNASWLGYKSRVVPIFDNDQLVLIDEGNYNLTKYISVRNCSGHTPGHQCVIFDDYEEEKEDEEHGDGPYIFIGDLVNRVVQISKPTLNGFPDVNVEVAIERRRELLNWMYDNDATVFAAHFGEEINPGKIVYCDHCNADNNLTWMSIDDFESADY